MKIEGLQLFTLFLGLVAFGVITAWLLIHRFRLPWLEDQAEDACLDAAIAERRAEAAGEPSVLARRTAPATSYAGWAIVTGARHRLRRSGCSSAAARVAKQVPDGPAALERPVTDALDDDPGSGHPAPTTPPAPPSTSRPAPARDGPPVRSAPQAPTRWRGWSSPASWSAIGFVVLQGLSNATLYFRNVDEALAQRDELGTRRFRLQGLVVADDAGDDGESTFVVAFNGAELAVGSPPPMRCPTCSSPVSPS